MGLQRSSRPGVSNSFSLEGHISLAVDFRGLKVILGPYKCNYIYLVIIYLTAPTYSFGPAQDQIPKLLTAQNCVSWASWHFDQPLPRGKEFVFRGRILSAISVLWICFCETCQWRSPVSGLMMRVGWARIYPVVLCRQIYSKHLFYFYLYFFLIFFSLIWIF